MADRFNPFAPVDPFTVPCKYCKAIAGQQCTNQVTGRPLNKPLAHSSRLVDADSHAKEAPGR